MARYADVILPLPLAGTYTYALPASLTDKVQVGCRLIVPFGPKKIYSAVVVGLHDEAPKADFQYKEALELLDQYPILLPQQLKLWRWIADYYLCQMGEVYKAALPSGMKLESESIVCFNPDYDTEQPLSKSEQKILEGLEEKKEQKVLDIQKSVGLKDVLPVIKSLLEKGALTMKEEVKHTYRPKTVNCVRLHTRFFQGADLDETLDALRRSPKQYEMLQSYLAASQASAALRLHNAQLLVEVEKSVLLENGSASIFKALKDKEILEVYEKNVGRLAKDSLPSELTVRPLSEAQQRAKDEIKQQFANHDVCLLHGVTSSGKTEVYIHLIREALDEGKQVLYLLPEIVLTAQLVERLKRVFGDRLGVYHSKYPDAERVEVWQKQLSNQPYDIIVGVRSSIFLPFQRLGLVIVDEEHETSFKQQDPAPRYHARNAALVLAHMYGAKSLLGTATPSLDSYYNVQLGKYGLVTLNERYQQVKLPEIRVVDVKDLRHRKVMKGPSPFSPPLIDAMRDALGRHEQVILFQNRRGFAPQIECRTCGWVPRCTNCDVTLTLHKGASRMTCHYCGASFPIPTKCPNCNGQELTSIGFGTERIEDDIQAIFPQAHIARMDLDTTRSRQAYEQILSDFQRGKTDILVGTQMVTKGLDFERVSVVGILNADTMLNVPDFRSYERAFQMMSQVAGRAGRRNAQGLVILQTKDPTVSVIPQVIQNDYASLYRDQMEERKAFNYPPLCRLIYVYMKHKDMKTVDALARDMGTYLRQVFGDRAMGPDVPPIGRVQLFYIRKMVLKIELGASLSEVRNRLRQLQAYVLSLPQYKGAQFYYDVDPL